MTDFPKLGRPAERALAQAGYTRLEQVSGASQAILLELHGVGPRTIRLLQAALREENLLPLVAQRRA